MRFTVKKQLVFSTAGELQFKKIHIFVFFLVFGIDVIKRGLSLYIFL